MAAAAAGSAYVGININNYEECNYEETSQIKVHFGSFSRGFSCSENDV